jgi:hypothetical protein
MISTELAKKRKTTLTETLRSVTSETVTIHPFSVVRKEVKFKGIHFGYIQRIRPNCWAYFTHSYDQEFSCIEDAAIGLVRFKLMNQTDIQLTKVDKDRWLPAGQPKPDCVRGIPIS